MTDQPSTQSICEYAGHDWQPAGGGIEICAVCEADRWADRDDSQTCEVCGFGWSEGSHRNCHRSPEEMS